MTADAELIALIMLLFVGGALIAHRIISSRSVLSFSTAALVAYLIVYPMSGVAHLLWNTSKARGYWDLQTHPDAALTRVVVTWSAFFALNAAINLKRRAGGRGERRAKNSRGAGVSFLVITGLLLVGVALPSLATMFSYVQTTGASRVIALTDGMARVGFMSQWIAWGISFLLIGLVMRPGSRGARGPVAALAAAGLLAIAASLTWTGGRTVVVMLGLPLLIALWPWIARLSKGALVAVLGGAFASFVVSVTLARTVSSAASPFDAARVLDWEMGRYSMIGYAIQSVESRGWLWGQTIVEGASQVPLGVLSLLGLDIQNSLRPVTYFTAMDILGDPTFFYIVPGLTAEWYMNFGWVGVVLAYVALGLAVRAVDSRIVGASEPIKRLVWGWAGVLLIACTFTAQTGSIFSYALFTGAPVLVLWVIDRARSSRERPGDPGVSVRFQREGTR